MTPNAGRTFVDGTSTSLKRGLSVKEAVPDPVITLLTLAVIEGALGEAFGVEILNLALRRAGKPRD